MSYIVPKSWQKGATSLALNSRGLVCLKFPLHPSVIQSWEHCTDESLVKCYRVKRNLDLGRLEKLKLPYLGDLRLLKALKDALRF
jgi:hypothetical protein